MIFTYLMLNYSYALCDKDCHIILKYDRILVENRNAILHDQIQYIHCNILQKEPSKRHQAKTMPNNACNAIDVPVLFFECNK